MKYIEANFDGLVGPTHNYSGLSYGNEASLRNANLASNPKIAALQGLKKAKAMSELGLVQGILAPQERPDIYTLKKLGFRGSDSQILEKAYKQVPNFFNACCSASSMWAANAATVSPSPDCADNKVHFTTANLTDKFHRSIEHNTTSQILQSTFTNPECFCHHPALPSHSFLGDEGAANHTRFCNSYSDSGIELFVYGEHMANTCATKPMRYPARQKRAASEAIARLHQLTAKNTFFMQQNPDAIDQGVFHNDVIAVGNRNVLFYHQNAFVNQTKIFEGINQRLEGNFELIEVSDSKVSVHDAVQTYLFNTQLIDLSDNSMALIAPIECKENPRVFAYLSELLTLKTPIQKVKYFDIKQSMQNGGGPACLRLRVVLSEKELNAVNPSTLLNDDLYCTLQQWVEKFYRDQLRPSDFWDIQLLNESRSALDELTQILNLGSIYPFQK